MSELWIALSDIPADGREFSFADQSIWQARWKEFGIAASPGERDLVAEVTILPQGENAALVRGTLKGSVSMPCDRCAAPHEIDVDIDFDIYEELTADVDEVEAEETRIRKNDYGVVELDMGALLWEELALALPVKPLCREDCKGLCPGCGRDLNTEECACDRDDGDPRLAVFRDLKIK
ncbi:DUF177 domain-containing protein [Salidesulfovibrio onnuriiensis]|uniref:DUF177 domain-containing protein n=1 Tax=Salidesulfovibrio onnuriiensis TaxID=2583823 RepID=UPI0011CC5907|nr:DUF177 domain-containing protein [Salidesulfovibrio onnuriiensis]